MTPKTASLVKMASDNIYIQFHYSAHLEFKFEILTIHIHSYMKLLLFILLHVWKKVYTRYISIVIN